MGRVVWSCLPLSVLAGCAGSVDTDQETGDEPVGWTWDGEAPDEEASADEIAVAVADLLGSLREINAQPVIDSYHEAMSYSLDVCPEQVITSSDATGDMTYWEGMCEGANGIWFKGPMTTWTWGATDIAAGSVDILTEIFSSTPSYEGYLFYGNGIRGQTDIFSSDGVVDFNCSCTAMQGIGVSDDGRVGYFSFMDGPSHWTGSTSAGTWMEEGVRPGLWVWAETVPTEGQKHLTAAGNVTGFSERLDTAKLDLTLFAPTDGSRACTAGEISSFSLTLRDSVTATWTSLAFTIDDSDPAACQGCATLESGEEVCVDMLPVLDWESAPW